MDDYSKYFEKPSEFVNNYEIENDEIVINTKNTDQGSIRRKQATKTRIKYYEKKLEHQYKTIIRKQEKILQDKINIKTIIYYAITVTICILSIISSSFSDILGMLLCGTSILTLLISSIDNAIFTIRFKSKLNLYEVFIREKKQIEKTYESNQNITKGLSPKSLNILNHNRDLKERNLIDSIFNIDLMDKISLQDLRKIIYAYSSHECLSESIIAENPELKIISYKDKIKRKIRRK